MTTTIMGLVMLNEEIGEIDRILAAPDNPTHEWTFAGSGMSVVPEFVRATFEDHDKTLWFRGEDLTYTGQSYALQLGVYLPVFHYIRRYYNRKTDK
jgi:hypothetical protein